MENEEKLNITLNIAGRPYSFRIDRNKEEIFRRAEKEINGRVAQIESKYQMDKEGCLAMGALELAKQNVEILSSRSLGDDIDEIMKLDRRLDEYLSKL